MAESQPQPVPRDGFDAVYQRQLRFVWRMLRYHGLGEDAIEDAVQDVFIVVHRRWHDFDPSGSERAWLFGIVRRVASAHRRSQVRHERRVRAAPKPGARSLPDEVVASRESLERLEQVLADMDEKLRTVFVLSVVEGMSAPEIAAATGAKLNTIYWRLRVAKGHVVEAMGTSGARDD